MIQILDNKRNRAKNKIPKSLLSIYFILALCFGLDLGFLDFISNKKYRISLKCVSFLMKILFLLSLIYTYINTFDYDFSNVTSDRTVLVDFLGVLFFWTLTVQCALYSFAVIVKKYTTYMFFLDLIMIDDSLSFLQSEMFGIAAAVYLVGMFFIKVMITIEICPEMVGSECDTLFRVIQFLCIHIPIFCVDAIALELFFIYYYLYSNIKFMKVSFGKSLKSLQELRDRYVLVANCFDKIRPHYDRMLLIELMLDLPKLVGLLWGTLVYLNLDSPGIIYLCDYFSASHVIFQIVLPAVIAERITAEVDAIKLVLHERLIQEQEDDPNILRFLRYLDARPLNHSLLGVIPVDLRLPVALFSLFTTYFIVIVQFTHLYN